MHTSEGERTVGFNVDRSMRCKLNFWASTLFDRRKKVFDVRTGTLPLVGPTPRQQQETLEKKKKKKKRTVMNDNHS
jgi:hypothetical protein